MRIWLAAIVALTVLPQAAAPTGAQSQTAAPSPGWVADPTTGCRAWSMRTGAGASMSWSGACRDGFASGNGVLVWVNGSRYEGEMKDGRYEGRGTFTATNGLRYEGEWRDYRPHGRGTLTRADGQKFSGAWSNGCFRQGARWSAFMTTPKECGFE